MSQHSLRRRIFQGAAKTLVPLQVVMGIPVPAGGHESPAHAAASPVAWAVPAAAVPATVTPVAAVPQSAAVDAPAPAPPAVPEAGAPAQVNRTRAQLEPVPVRPVFSARPGDGEFFQARLFAEPLVPIGRATNEAENLALAEALTRYVEARDVGVLEDYLARTPDTAWRVALLTNLGTIYRRSGYYSQALGAWQEAWRLSKRETEPLARATAERALAELAQLWARLGRYESLEALWDEIEGRDVRGPAAELLQGAREGFALMQQRPELAFRCGPLSIESILMAVRPQTRATPLVAEAISAAQSTRAGTSLAHMVSLAAQVGLDLQAAFREDPAAAPLVPALVHWKAGHFAAIVAQEGDAYLVNDPTFGDELWVSRAALKAEASGYFLVPVGALPAGWRQVAASEAATVWGKGAANQTNTNAQGPNNKKKPCKKKNKKKCGKKKCPLADYDVHLMLVSLNLEDTPVGYEPPRGPGVEFTVTYNQRDSFQPSIFTYSNLGYKWTFDWLSYVEEAVEGTPPNLTTAVYVYERGGGREKFSGISASDPVSDPDYLSRAVLRRTSDNPIRYQRELPDGSLEVFAQSDGASAAPRKVFMTEAYDPQGNRVQFHYDANLRLVEVEDAIGQITTLSYELGGNPASPDYYRITRVSDPFGRAASLRYNASGQLERITDILGLTSQFNYGSGDFINALITPYGTTLFAWGSGTGLERWIEITDPLGAKERVEYKTLASLDFGPLPSVPGVTFSAQGGGHTYVTAYYDKSTYPYAPDETKATLQTAWLTLPNDAHILSDVPHSEKEPLEGRVWYAYPGQLTPTYAGSDARPTTVARVLDDPDGGGPQTAPTQAWRYEYNSYGQTTKATDPLGRETLYEYAANGLDLTQVKQKNAASPGGYDVLATLTYNTRHLPLTLTDAAAQTTRFTYTPLGQLTSATTPPRAGLAENRTTTLSYDPSGYLLGLSGPATGATLGYTYDGYGRVRTLAGPDGYKLTYDYDPLDRPTRVTYPDATYEEATYEKLDVSRVRDRLGRTTHIFRDPLARVGAVTDPLGRTTRYEWCNCGGLDKLIDPNGNATTWERDEQSRVTREIKPDGKDVLFVYEATTSRLKEAHDALSPRQVKSYAYFLDDNLKQVSYSNAVVATPTVSFTYDTVYGRLESMSDGIGTTSYGYHPMGGSPGLGAGQLSSIQTPLPGGGSSTVSYTYDEWGRVKSRGLTGATQSYGYDALGRIASESSPVGSFAWAYDGATARPLSLTYPNAQNTQYSYFPASGDFRLQQIKHLAPAAVLLSQFDYTYDAVGNIKTWAQQLQPSPTKVYDFGYDAADQLLAATLKSSDPVPVLLKRYGYAYDLAGNRTAEQSDDTTLARTYNNRNQLTSPPPQAGGALFFRGTVNEPARVNVQGQSSSMTAPPQNRFESQVPLSSGTNTVAVAATDAGGNTRTNTYQVTAPTNTGTYTYNANGSLTGDGTRTFEYDAEERLTRALSGGSEVARFVYDGFGRRVQKIAGGVTRTYLYDAEDIVEERASSGSTLRFVHGPGIDQPLAQYVPGGAVVYLLADHLGSIVQQTSSAGAVTFTREYDPYGNLLTGAAAGRYAFTGREWDPETGLYYYRARYYDPKLGRFLSEDPIGFAAGPNVYAYADGDPIGISDPLGLMGKGERGRTAKPEGTGDPFKHMKPHPTDPSKVKFRDPHTGKEYDKPKPHGFDDWWKKKHPQPKPTPTPQPTTPTATPQQQMTPLPPWWLIPLVVLPCIVDPALCIKAPAQTPAVIPMCAPPGPI